MFLGLDGTANSNPVRLGGLDLFGGAGGRAGASSHRDGVDSIAFDASNALAELSRVAGFDMQKLRVSLVRRSFALTTGEVFIPSDPDPPRIGAIELIRA